SRRSLAIASMMLEDGAPPVNVGSRHNLDGDIVEPGAAAALERQAVADGAGVRRDHDGELVTRDRQAHPFRVIYITNAASAWTPNPEVPHGATRLCDGVVVRESPDDAP